MRETALAVCSLSVAELPLRLSPVHVAREAAGMTMSSPLSSPLVPAPPATFTTWNGSNGLFSTGANWSTQAAPASYYEAVINAGIVTAAGTLPGFLVIDLNSSSASGAALVLSGTTLVASSQLNMNASGTNATLRLSGAANNAGVIKATGNGAAFLQIDDAPGGGATNFVNTGLIQVSGTNFQLVTAGGNAADQLENDGVISVRSSTQAPLLAYVSANLAGTGTVVLGPSVTYEAAQAVGAGQTFVFEHGSGNTTLRIESGPLFAATVSGFVSSDTIQLSGGQWDKAAYASTSSSGGVLTLSLGGVAVQSITFAGSYTVNSFKLQEVVPTGDSQASTAIVVDDPLFDSAYYLSNNPDVAAAGVDPYQHFMAHGWNEGRNPNAWFDVSYYLGQSPDVAAAGANALTHFEQYGWREGRDPSLLFSSAKYSTANPDVKAAGVDPLLHYVQYGQSEGRAASLTGGTAAADTLIDPAFYDQQLGATIVPGGTAGQQQAAWSYDASGWQKGLNPDGFFDSSYYLA